MDMEVDLPNLPNDIIWFQILTRLPAKSLMRFKCVCKFWSSSLFPDPHFVRADRNMHKNQNSKTTHLLLLRDWSTTTEQKELFSMQLKHELGFINSPTLQDDIDVLLSQDTQMTSSNSRWGDTSQSFGVNGLICLCNEDAAVPVRIFNPCTREFTTLPVSQFVPAPGRRSIRLNTYHIGYSPVTNEYKVFHIHHKYEIDRLIFIRFEIFTLGSTSKSWRDVPKIGFDEEWHSIDSKTVCIHGAIHWAVMKMNRQTTIVAFDVGEERFREIPLPQDWSDSERFYNMIEVNGCLAMYDIEFYNRRTTSIGIWILKDYQNQVWIEESIVLPEERYKLGWPVPVCTIHTGELLLYCSEEGFRDVHLYDMKRKSFRKTEIKFPGRISILASYDESIVPL